ncbi:MAG: VIT1/CCC1 transporter family protein [Acidobacteria bacterium]|nr:VIT1/CCC1 transporter family protein [Acidobacteriota bacterium]MCZ6740251.1 VIT1/CCC1 transporter family protein [Actinomycetota bacterium]
MDVENQETHEYISHIGESRPYWRDIILGVNDGLVSIFLLVVGVVGGGFDTAQVLLTAVAGALAGAVSMAAGEYLATKSQDEILEAELALERTHIIHFKDQELEQLRGFFTDMGVGEADLNGVIAGFENNDEAILNAMAALEFGVVESERRSPYLAMAASGLLFLVGSSPSVVPFVLIDSTGTALIWATALSLAGLFLVGVVKARVAKSHWLQSGFENMTIAGVGGVIAWAIGNAIGATLG